MQTSENLVNPVDGIGAQNASDGKKKCGLEGTKYKKRKSFDERMKDLRSYKERNGHLHLNKIRMEDTSLACFCSNLRSAYKGKEEVTQWLKLTDDRIASLNALGFVWSGTAKTTFEEKIEALKAYKAKHGHINVKQSEDLRLGNFCAQVRHAHRNQGKRGNGIKLTEKRIASLDALDFQWDVKKSSSAPK
ncbi:hypothetical protein ACHAXR_000194 [Thalassiosira sp. AJA248-18]